MLDSRPPHVARKALWLLAGVLKRNFRGLLGLPLGWAFGLACWFRGPGLQGSSRWPYDLRVGTGQRREIRGSCGGP